MLKSIVTLCLLPIPCFADVPWPDFRGPTQDGHAPVGATPPVAWSETENIRWKTAIHGKAWSSPVIWGDRIWLTTASEDGKQMSAIAVHKHSGAILFDQVLFNNETVRPLGNRVNAYGSPSPTIEPGRVYIHFGSYGTACLDTTTFTTLWTRTDFVCDHFRGPASSPVLYKDTVILTFDGADEQYMVALNKHNGEQVWRTDRSTDFKDLNPNGKPKGNGDFRKAYGTPVIDGDRLYINGAKAAYAYEAATGKEIWQVTFKEFSAASRIVFDDTRMYINTGYPKSILLGVKRGGKGMITDSHVLWSQRKGVPRRSSPLLIDGYLYMTTDEGVGTCLAAATGEVVWQDRIRGHFSGSPIYANGLIYFFSEQGAGIIVKPGKTFEIVATNQLDEGCMASPAITGNDLVVRTKHHLYRIGETK